MDPLLPSKISFTYFPKRDELLFLIVLALPNAYNTGLHFKILSSMLMLPYTIDGKFLKLPDFSALKDVRNFIQCLAP